MNCEHCQKPIADTELDSPDANTPFKFFDNIQKKDVAYHAKCYADRFNAPHAINQ